MAKPVHRLNDPNSAGGVVNGPLQDFVFDQGQEISVNGSGVTPHTPFVPPQVATALEEKFSRK